MIGYVCLGTNDLERARAFCEPLFEASGGRVAFQTDSMVAFGFGDGAPLLMITRPHDGKGATVGNGVMVALKAPSPDAIDALHKKALQLGATDEGAPGPRGKSFYGAYFRDLDGNKLNFFCNP